MGVRSVVPSYGAGGEAGREAELWSSGMDEPPENKHQELCVRGLHA